MAELRDILQNNDFKLYLQSVNTLPNTPTRAQIEDVLSDNGVSLPLPRNNMFYIRAVGGRTFLVVYNKEIDEYYFEKLTRAM